MHTNKQDSYTVRTQAELDAIPHNFAGCIFIEADDTPITLTGRYKRPVFVGGYSKVIAVDAVSPIFAKIASASFFNESSILIFIFAILSTSTIILYDNV